MVLNGYAFMRSGFVSYNHYPKSYYTKNKIVMIQYVFIESMLLCIQGMHTLGDCMTVKLYHNAILPLLNSI